MEEMTVYCLHCGVRPPLAAGFHLPAGSDTPALAVGQRVTARCNTGVSRAKERGVVTGWYRSAERRGWTILFEHGRWADWSVCEVGLWLEPGTVCSDLAAYTCRDHVQLLDDWRRGRFAAAFAEDPAGRPVAAPRAA